MAAYALETQPELLPFMAELLQDIDELGTDAELVAEVLAPFGLSPHSRVLDLGCGKGATAVEIADEFGCRVTGIDLLEPFLMAAEAYAAAAGVSELCRFVRGDVVRMHGELAPVDVAVFGAMGDVLGPPEETIGILRRYVKPNGLIVVSDGYLKGGGTADYPGFESYAEREATRRRLEAHGDRIEVERLEVDEVSEVTDEVAHIRRRAIELGVEHPQMATRFLAFADSQTSENRYLEDNIQGVVWVLRKR